MVVNHKNDTWMEKAGMRSTRVEAEEDLKARFKAIRKHFGLSQAAMAERIGLTKNGWQMIEEGRLPAGSAMRALSDMGISTDWLLTGEGPMLRGGDFEAARASGKPDLVLFDTSALNIAMRQVDLIEQQTGRRLGPDARATAITGLYLALMKDRADGQPDPEVE